MIKLLCITGSMGSGGAETFMMKLFRNMDTSKIHMDFCVAVDHECLYDREIIEAGSKIHHITAKTKSAKQYKKDLKQLLENEKYDVVLRLGDTCFSFYDLWIAKKTGVKKVAFRSCNSNFLGSNIQLIFHKVFRGVLSGFIDVKIAPSTEAARFTFGNKVVDKGDVHILHNGVELSEFEYTELGRDEIRQELGITNKYVIGHIGRFNEQKNHMFLVDIFSEIAKQQNDAVLLLVGVGELENEVKKKVQELALADRTIFTGVRRDIGKILSAMDVFVFPSIFEGMPNTVIEAQANGLNCVVSDSITMEADITGLVHYVSLEKSSDEWAEIVLETDGAHHDTKIKFKEKHYDIQSTAESFCEIVVEER